MCEFPSALLLRLTHEAAALADASNDPAKITYAAGFIKAVSDLRLWHEDLTGCTCWYETIKQSNEDVREVA